MAKKVNIIGAGIAGSLAAHLLREAGVDVRVIDDRDPYSASLASSNLFVAGWMAKFKGKGAEDGMKILERLFAGKIDQPFSGGIAAAGKVKHIAQRHLLVEPDVFGRAMQVTKDGVDVIIPFMQKTETFLGPTLVCTGYRAAELLGKKLDVWVKVGHCYKFKGDLAPGASRLAIVSPYTHEKLYQFEPGVIYYADSVAVKQEVYAKRLDELKERTLARARKLIGELETLEHRIGYRPFVDGHDFGFAREVDPNVWAINGGGKNGMVAYAQGIAALVPKIKERASC